MTEAQVRELGVRIRNEVIKPLARDGDPKAGPLRVPLTYEAPSPTAEPDESQAAAPVEVSEEAPQATPSEPTVSPEAGDRNEAPETESGGRVLPPGHTDVSNSPAEALEWFPKVLS